MGNPNPATPDPKGTATPGSGEQAHQTPPAAPSTPPTGGQGGAQDGKVSITSEEYRNLLRDQARARSFEKRRQFEKSRNNPPAPGATNGEGEADPELVETLRQEQEARAAAETRAMRAEVSGKVRDLLEKEEFKSLPASTKALILKNPSVLSSADNVEEALLDIEDFVREEVSKLGTPSNPQQNGQNGGSRSEPSGHETPTRVGSGAPVTTDTGGLEDTAKLTGPARSRAVLRNQLKRARMGGEK